MVKASVVPDEALIDNVVRTVVVEVVCVVVVVEILAVVELKPDGVELVLDELIGVVEATVVVVLNVVGTGVVVLGASVLALVFAAVGMISIKASGHIHGP